MIDTPLSQLHSTHPVVYPSVYAYTDLKLDTINGHKSNVGLNAPIIFHSKMLHKSEMRKPLPQNLHVAHQHHRCNYISAFFLLHVGLVHPYRPTIGLKEMWQEVVRYAHHMNGPRVIMECVNPFGAPPPHQPFHKIHPAVRNLVMF